MAKVVILIRGHLLKIRMVLAAHFKPNYTTRDYIYEKTNYEIIVYYIYFNSASKQD